MKRVTWVVSGISVVWIAGLAALIHCRWTELVGMDLNELGDFLAGTMSPLALFWLVAGYRQQGEELKMNTQALIDQHEVMKLQRAEMAAQVELYKQMVEQATEQAMATRRMASQSEMESMMTTFKPGYQK